jgi:hypothetical protein
MVQEKVQDKKKGKIDLKKGFDIVEGTKRAVAVPYIIDTNKRKKFGDEPKMTE